MMATLAFNELIIISIFSQGVAKWINLLFAPIPD